MKEIQIAEMEGFRVGNAQNEASGTGCTVVIYEEGVVAGVDVRGGSPGTRETDALNPRSIRENIHAVLLAGGSAFGLDAAGNVMQFLEEKGVGRDVAVAKVPIVCGAILFDLKCGDYKIRPDRQMGYDACRNAYTLLPEQGNFGAGTGATVGKAKGTEYAMKGGLGIACFQVGSLKAGAVMAVNCVGDIFDGRANKVIAGALNDDKRTFAGAEDLLLSNCRDKTDFFSENTIIGTVITNAKLSKAQANRLASVSHDGIARAVRPSHTVFDGDSIFTMATGKVDANMDAVGILAARAVERAIINSVQYAKAAYGYPSFGDFSEEVRTACER